MKKEDPSMCPTCNDPMTVKHILTDCRKYELQRQKCNLTHNLAENLNFDIINVLKFLRDTELHKKIEYKYIQIICIYKYNIPTHL